MYTEIRDDARGLVTRDTFRGFHYIICIYNVYRMYIETILYTHAVEDTELLHMYTYGRGQ